MKKTMLFGLAMAALVIFSFLYTPHAQSQETLQVKIEKLRVEGFSGGKQEVVIPYLEYTGHDPSRKLFLKIEFKFQNRNLTGSGIKLVQLDADGERGVIKNISLGKFFRKSDANLLILKITLLELDGEKVIRQSNIQETSVRIT